jgi:hypothetical protein
MDWRASQRLLGHVGEDVEDGDHSAVTALDWLAVAVPDIGVSSFGVCHR